ncbi:MAG: heat shock protein HspQ [Pseudomonadales bacterium]|jgi:heat shock protein HspQ
MATARFFVGQLVDHLMFGYRGVVFGVDSEFSLSEEWYDQVARSRPPKDQPWYQVMVDGATNTTYVAERHLQPSENLAQIDNPFLGEYFSGFNGHKYLPRQPVH